SHNVEYVIWQRLCQNETNWLKKLLLQLEWRKLRHYEVSACKRAALTITVSDADREHFLQLAPTSHIQSTPTGVDIDYFQAAPPEGEHPNEIVFCGSMDWFPNEDAMLWFCDTMLPAIRARMPDVTLTIIGRNPGARIKALADGTKIRVTGTVDDVRPHVAPAAVYIVPLRIGGGTRLKIFEALAMGKAIVSTTVGAEGLPLEDGKHIVLADTPEAFAEKIVALLRHPSARHNLGKAGRQLVETRYSWARITDTFDSLCQSACEPATPQTLLATPFNSHNLTSTLSSTKGTQS
ncbi:MAG: glycosyltransferase family 4 protein, partial [Pseudomonadota bacterium]